MREGYYWIKVRGGSWIIGLYEYELWWVCGSDHGIHGSVVEVGPPVRGQEEGEGE